jgi:hypothetical protein
VQWSTIAALWHFSLTIWRHRNKKLHGNDGEISQEQAKRTAAFAQVQAVYTDTIGNVSPSASLILHRQRLTNMMTWTKQHLDAYLATAEMACDWNVEPG